MLSKGVIDLGVMMVGARWGGGNGDCGGCGGDGVGCDG